MHALLTRSNLHGPGVIYASYEYECFRKISIHNNKPNLVSNAV